MGCVDLDEDSVRYQFRGRGMQCLGKHKRKFPPRAQQIFTQGCDSVEPLCPFCLLSIVAHHDPFPSRWVVILMGIRSCSSSFWKQPKQWNLGSIVLVFLCVHLSSVFEVHASINAG